MNQFPLRPSINALINTQASTLPIGTLLRGYELKGPDMVVLYATQPTVRSGMECKAVVHIWQQAIEDRGEAEAVGEALKILRDMALHRSLPRVNTEDAAPLVAVVMSTEVQLHHPTA